MAKEEKRLTLLSPSDDSWRERDSKLRKELIGLCSAFIIHNTISCNWIKTMCFFLRDSSLHMKCFIFPSRLVSSSHFRIYLFIKSHLTCSGSQCEHGSLLSAQVTLSHWVYNRIYAIDFGNNAEFRNYTLLTHAKRSKMKRDLNTKNKWIHASKVNKS